MYLTKKQKEVYSFIQQFIEGNGYSPSFEEIAKGLGLSSMATIHKHISSLTQKGAINRSPNKSRSIELLKVPYNPKMEPVYIRGVVSAGKPIEAIEIPEEIMIPQEFLYGDDMFVLKVSGESMIEEQICDGDYIIVEKRQTADNGETVVALINNSEATVKKFYLEGDKVRLQPANQSMQPIFVDPNNVKIQGVVVGLIRKFK